MTDTFERLMPATGCPQGTYWNDMYGRCMPTGIPQPPPPTTGFWPYFPPPNVASEEAVGFWPYFPPPHVPTEVGCDDCDSVVSGDPCAGAEAGSVAMAFFNPIGAIIGAQETKECKERRMRHGRGREREHERGHERHEREHRHHAGCFVGWDGEWEPWRHHRHHHRPWWEKAEEQFYVGATPAGDPVKAPAHPAVQDTTAAAAMHPATQAATTQAAQAPGATPSHVADVSQAATHAIGSTAAAATATQAAQSAAHPETATSAASAAEQAATHARTATQAATAVQAPGTQAARAARTSAAHASRAASHAHAATEARSRGEAEHHERAAQSHGRAAAAHARMAHGEARRGPLGRREFGRAGAREWWRRPEFADYERRYGKNWQDRPEFSEFRWRYGGEWWRRPEFVDYERTYGAEWWLRPEFEVYRRRYEVEAPDAQAATAEGQAVCILPGDDGSCLKEMVTRSDGAIFYRVTDAGAGAGIQLDQDEMARNAALGMGAPAGGDMGDAGGDDTATSGNFAGWGHGGGDLFTDPYGRFDPRMPAAWDAQFMYYPDYYYGMDPRVGIQSGPAIVGAQVGPQIEGGFDSLDPRVGIQSGPAIVGIQSGPAIVGLMADQSRGMQGGFYHSTPEIEAQAAQEQIEAMYLSFAGFGAMDDGMPGTYPGYGFGGWGSWGHGF